MCYKVVSTIYFSIISCGLSVLTVKKGMFLSSAVSSLLDSFKRFTLHPWQTRWTASSALHFTPGRPVGPLQALYTSPLADPLDRFKRFTLHPWQTRWTASSALHFTPWQTRWTASSALHFTPWQTCWTASSALHFTPGRPVGLLQVLYTSGPFHVTCVTVWTLFSVNNWGNSLF